MRRTLGVLVVLVTTGVVGFTVSVAMAANIENLNGQSCGEGVTGTWHFIHNQTSAPSGIITATFSGGGDGPTADTPSPSPNLHYYVQGTGTLLSAQDNVNGGKLVLSHFTCDTPPPPTEPPPTDPPPTDPPPSP